MKRSPAIAVLLSFLWPGLGQLYAGRRRAAALFGVPVLLVVAGLAVEAAGGIEDLVGLAITPTGAFVLMVGVGLVGLWRLASMAEAGLRGRPGRPGRGTLAVLLGLSVVVVGSHGWADYAAWSLWDASNQVFVADVPSPSPSGSALPSADASPTPSPSDLFLATPFATPAHASSRINFLVTGIDSGPGRNHTLTDTLIVVSVDPVTRKVAMISFPRDIAQFPLWDGRIFPGKINSLMTEAALHPQQYPDGPLPTLVRELGFLLGIPIHYYAAVNLPGFASIIDAVGGVTVNVERPIADPTYNWSDGVTPRGFYLKAGRQHMNGRIALAYARSRMGAGDNDFTRARRQQLLLLALRDRLTSPGLIPRIPSLIRAIGRTIRTDFPAGRVGEMLKLAGKVGRSDVTQVVLQPPTYTVHPPTNTTGGTYILRLQMSAIEALSIQLFGEDSAYFVDAPASPSPGGSPGPSASP